MRFNVLRLELIDIADLVSSAFVSVNQLVQLGMDRLGVPVSGPLYEKGHDPGGDGRDTVKVERLLLDDIPNCDVEADQDKSRRVRGEHADMGERAPHAG